MVNVREQLVDLGSLCLLDFANNLPPEEGPPLYMIYPRKLAVLGQKNLVRDGKCWVIVRDFSCDFVTVSDVVIERPTKIQPQRKTTSAKTSDLHQNEMPVRRNVSAETCYRPGKDPLSLYLFSDVTYTCIPFILAARR